MVVKQSCAVRINHYTDVGSLALNFQCMCSFFPYHNHYNFFKCDQLLHFSLTILYSCNQKV